MQHNKVEEYEPGSVDYESLPFFPQQPWNPFFWSIQKSNI